MNNGFNEVTIANAGRVIHGYLYLEVLEQQSYHARRALSDAFLFRDAKFVTSQKQRVREFRATAKLFACIRATSICGRSATFDSVSHIATQVFSLRDDGNGLYTSKERVEKAVGNATLYAFDAETGKELYSSGKIIASFTRFGASPFANGHVYVSTYDNTVYSFRVKQD